MMDQLEPVLTGDDAIVSDALLRYVPSFANRGFDLLNFTLEGSAKLQRFPLFHFLNKRTGMRMDISFLTSARGLNGGFNVLLIKPKNRKLDVEDYLKLHKLEELTKPFTYRDLHTPTTPVGRKTDIRAFADSFFQSLLALFDKELKPIVDGRAFEETPVDWMGYR